MMERASTSEMSINFSTRQQDTRTQKTGYVLPQELHPRIQIKKFTCATLKTLYVYQVVGYQYVGGLQRQCLQAPTRHIEVRLCSQATNFDTHLFDLHLRN
jgi:hypothetical protein